MIFEYRAADSFPIYYADVPGQEAKAHHLHGKRATTARFGGPPPIGPQLQSEMKSLYEMQLQAKKARA
jgi:hypothetical protein